MRPGLEYRGCQASMWATVSWVVWCLWAICETGAEKVEKKQIYLAGTFPISGSEGWQGGQACLPAALLALDDVNKNKDILKNYHINLAAKDDECDSGLGAYRLYELIYQEKDQKVIIISGCSTVCTTLAEAANQWNLVTVCYGASSPALSNRERFPTLFRTHPSATVHNPTRVNVFQRYKWTRISVIQEAEEVFVTTLDDLEKEAKKENIEIVNRQIFKDNPEAVVRNLKHQDARIIVGLFYAKTARKVLCEIYKNKMFGPKYVWFFIGWYEDDWFMDQEYLQDEGIECTQDQMIEAAQGHFTTEALMWNQNRKEQTYSGRTVDQFEQALRESMAKEKKYKEMFNKNKTPEGFLEAPLAYDAVWAIALALNSSAAFLEAQNQSLDSYNYDNKAVADIIQDNMEKVKFNGISGSVAFSETTGDRMAWTMIEQLVETKYTVVGYYDQRTDNLTWNTDATTGNELVWWPKGKIPQDRTIIKSDIKTVALTIYIPMVIISVIGIILALILIIINNKFNYRRIIQHSHPSCNNLILTGTILCLLATIPLGMNTRWIPEGLFPTFCAAPKWLLHIGFSLGYGSMFTKIWRVHRIATHTKTKGEDKIKYIGMKPMLETQVVPWKLWSMVGCLVAVDVLFVTIWQIVDPLKKEINAFDTIPSDNEDEDVEYQPEIWVCRSDYHNVWLGLTYGYKGLLLILGLFLAYETRSVKVKQINDSRLVGMSIYNVAILCIITAPVTMVISDQQNATFAFVALANVFCCYLSMALVFVPKVVFIVQHPGHDPREREDEDEKKKQEQEMKLKKILKENEELQKDIAEKDRKIDLLRKHLAMKKEIAEREAKEAERLAMDTARGVAQNGNCRLRTSIDVKRTESLRGITVFRGQIPGSCSSKDTLESYL